jgi:hypothetical protein
LTKTIKITEENIYETNECSGALITVTIIWCRFTVYTYFFIGIVEGGVQSGPFGTAATNRPIVSPQGDYDDREIGGMMIGRGNRSKR